MINLCKALQKNVSLKTLKINSNGIEWRGLSILKETLKLNSSLENLHLSENTLGDEGARILAECINFSLENLCLRKAGIRVLGIRGLIQALREEESIGRCCIGHIDLLENPISQNELHMLEQSLEHSKRIHMQFIIYDLIRRKPLFDKNILKNLLYPMLPS